MLQEAGRRPQPYDHDDHDDPCDPLPRPRGGSTVPTTTQEARGWWVGGEWIEQASPHNSQQQQQYDRTAPIVIDDDEDSDCYEVPPPVPQSAKSHRRPGTHHAAPAVESFDTHFDFNNREQALPWQTKRDKHSEYHTFSFAQAADDALLSYLAERSVSRGFLVEIDQFLREHPEIADSPEGRDTLIQLNTLPPLEAYRYFLRGYTRPARYIDGIIKSDYFVLPASYPYKLLRTKIDPELVDFFEGFEYRWDIIERIDQIVCESIRELSRGRPLRSGFRRLVCYALWGNPSDAYKWYEYSLQEDYLPHRYLPEHVVLGHVPRLTGDAEPRPSSLDPSRRHLQVRHRMARANDEGVDVLEVLLTEFRETLIRRGFRRTNINNMYKKARDRLENERRYPTGVDIVDLVMDDVPTERPARRLYVSNQYTRSAPNHLSFSTATVRPFRKRKNNNVQMKYVPSNLRTQAAELRSSRMNLERAYQQEQKIQDVSSQYKRISLIVPEVTAARARAERRYVNCIIRYLRNTNRMSSVDATQMQANFTRQKMQKAGMSSRAYLLGMYPQELT